MQHFKVAARDEGISSVLIVDDHPLFSDALASALEGVFPLCRFEKARSLKHALKVLDDGFSPDLVMFDRQTNSYWWQVAGEAIVGTLTGKRLTTQLVCKDDQDVGFSCGIGHKAILR